ncbi:transcriptional regulator, MarR family [Kribbella flavida DSM 17836]|uniref:Transcriptional regulator, MarR family n=1 Tax=Kribbella flavida (strain DSM 17836 / JCM 10339 / NBRC 14399) TaxID=479435 RepID=D2Q3S6_KRIFD|nr:MarR family transcriptional regulator [Kribbella flavida]ADB35948.1 transcriptional regulator, MarR family [Kribbella flavida DSM 17836]
MDGALGTQLRHLLEQIDGDVAKVYRDLGLAEYRPRFSPIVRTLVAQGPLSVRELALAVGVTHSAASQTVAQLTKAGFTTQEPGPTDARQRIVHLTDRTRELLPAIEAEWTATTAALASLDRELPYPLADFLAELQSALTTKPFRQRIADHAGAELSGSVVKNQSERPPRP